MHPSQKQLSQHAIISLKGKRDTPPHTHTPVGFRILRDSVLKLGGGRARGRTTQNVADEKI